VKSTADILTRLRLHAVGILLVIGQVFAAPSVVADELLIDARQRDASYPLGVTTNWQTLPLDTQIPDEHRWQRRNSDLINLGTSQDAQWLRIRFSATGATDASAFWMFSLGTSNARVVDFYHAVDGLQLVSHHSGSGVPYAERTVLYRQIVFPIKLIPGQHELLVRIEHGSSLSLEPSLSTRSNWVSRVLNGELSIVVYLGLVAVLALYSLAVFIRLREPEFGYFALCLGGAALWVMADTGVASQLLYPSHPFIHPFALRVSLGICLAGLLLFSRSVLAVGRSSPALARGMVLFGGCIAVACLFPVFRHFP